MKSILQIAINELGTKEIVGSQGHNPRIIEYANEAGFTSVGDDETAWCSIFMNWVAMKANFERTKKMNARSWLNIGLTVTNPEPGNMVIFWRGSKHSWQGHVAIFIGFSKDGNRIFCLGGNQGNQVSITAYSKDRLLGFRKLQNIGKLELPDCILKKEDTGQNVVTLQEALKLAGFDCGTSDGVFGDKTEEALKDLQSSCDKLEIDGVYGRKTKEFLETLLS